MVKVTEHRTISLWNRFKRDLDERFLKFETFNGFFILIPWGAGFFYYGFPWNTDVETFFEIVSQPQFGYNYGMLTLGIVLIIWGIRKTVVNRVKNAAIMAAQVEERKDTICYSTSDWAS